MNEFSNHSDNGIGGISAKKLLWPIILILIILHASIIFLIINISAKSSGLSQSMKASGEYISDATSLLAGSSLLSETCTNFVLMPKTENGEINIAPLAAYSEELGKDRRGDQVNERFKKYNIPKADKDLISKAAICSNFMMDAQLHAFSFINAVYPFPDNPNIDAIKLRKLTKKEQALPDNAKLAAARVLVLGSEYGLNKQTVSTNVNACSASLEEETAHHTEDVQKEINILRTALWIVAALIILILAATFILFYRYMIRPLNTFVDRINASASLNERFGSKEIRTVARSYNMLLRRRDALDSILRSAAETDTLTSLPNRYSFEQYLLESEEMGFALAIILFDVNFLKATNDTQGHAAGDRLLLDSAKCISKCFDPGDEGRCFRLGGDEFAAVLKDSNPAEIDDMIKRFKNMQDSYSVSVACGYAYTDDIEKTTVKLLMSEADKNMYSNKKNMHADVGRDTL